MPELPEVETVRRGIEAQVVGHRITAVEVGRERTVRRTSREALIDGLTGVTVIGERADLTYDYDYLGAGPETLAKFLASEAKAGARPMVIVGQGAIDIGEADGTSVIPGSASGRTGSLPRCVERVS